MNHETGKITIETAQTLDSMLHQILNQALVAISAEAGSLMLVNSKRGVLQIKARLGKPRRGRRTEPEYKIGEKGIASWVVQKRQSYLCSDVEKDPVFTESFSGKNFLSVLSVPVLYKDGIIAVINADAEEKNYFTEKHKETLEFVARQVAAPIAERISVLDALAEVGVELLRLPSEGGVERVLKRITQLAARSLGADAVILYQYIQEKDEFPVEGTGPTIAGEIWDPSPMRRRVYPKDVPWRVVKERRSGFYSDVHDVDILFGEVERPGDTPRPRFAERENIKSMAALLLPFRAAELEDEEVVGVMFANYRTPHEFSGDEISALATFADYAAVAILNARREEQRRAEQMRRADYQRRVEQVRMIETISALFAHRMSNLAGIGRINVQLLREKIDSADGYSLGLLEEIEHESDILLKLADRMIRPFKETGSILELVPIDAVRILEEEVKRIKSDPSHIGVTKDLAPDLPRVQSAEFQLREVLHDMLSNAIVAMKDQVSGRLMIRARFNKSSERVEIEISDTGPGIPNDLRDKLFNPGVTTKKDSLGIGLWYCRTFMQATGGDVVLRDTWPGKGSTFVIEIPCAGNGGDGSMDVRSAMDRRKEPLEADILIVDDDDQWRSALVKILGPGQYSVETASNYAEASRALATTHFKLAILDVRLVDTDPENKDGLRLSEDIDKAGLDTKVIIVTGYGTEQDELIARQSPRLLSFIDKGKMNTSKLRELVCQAVS
jgi:signal transduction histidine kinase